MAAEVAVGRLDALTGEVRALYLESAVYQCLDEPSEIRELLRHPDVRWALAEVRVGLAEAGMLRATLLGPNRAARRRVTVLRKAFPLPSSRHGLTDDRKLIAVALHGKPALRTLVPRFALRAGLTERVSLRNKGLRHSAGGGTYGSGGSP
ncbi:hypothetical protein SHKM778_30810 [Streptomyces sp. KM77-8]|uniref:Uncharacterized protein n=1 Tax=Streptomyces haneummycinicus TaxID=3074435 RepID=A0AAT9HH52_9ACTN